jgi:hypothetical protein
MKNRHIYNIYIYIHIYIYIYILYIYPKFSIHSFIHSFIHPSIHSSINFKTLPNSSPCALPEFPPSHNLSTLTSQWSCLLLSPQVLICPFLFFFFSFPMAGFFLFYYFRRKLMKIVETSATKWILFFNIWWRELLTPYPPKRQPCQRHCLPPLTFTQCSESAGVSALTNLHLFECDAWKKPEPLD